MPPLSARGRRLAAESPFAEYMLASRDNAHRRWTPERRDGFVDLSVAENRLVWDLLEGPLSAERAMPAHAAGYDDVRGAPALRQAVAHLGARTFLGRRIDPDRIFALAGAGAVLEALFYALCDPGDGVLLATPGYAGFWMDLEVRDQAVVVPAPTRWEDGFRVTIDTLDRAYAASDRPVRALLVASPDNPTGRVLTPDDIRDLVAWCRRRSIHAVFDEVYALSVHDGSAFTGVASVCDLADDVHVVWALSKDFAVSGLRCGVLITENEPLGRAVSSQGIWSGVSGRTQHLFAELLADTTWTDRFITEMRRRLSVAHAVASGALTEAGVDHLPARAGFFLMVDLRDRLAEPTFEAERALWRRLVDDWSLNVTPGAACRAPEPGFFRLCYAAAEPEAIEIGIARLGDALD